MTATILRGNALDLPLADGSVDLVVTSPPYFGLRSYQDGGQHYDGQLGSEATPAEFVDALLAATAEAVRVLKPSGSLWVNLGDKYGGSSNRDDNLAEWSAQNARGGGHKVQPARPERRVVPGGRPKSLIGIPWRYALRCIDDLGLILRAEVIWAKPNGLPESVTDRVRRSHEQWFHFTREPRYYSAVDEIREGYEAKPQRRFSPRSQDQAPRQAGQSPRTPHVQLYDVPSAGDNPLGKLPGSVWTVPTQPLKVPAHLGVDHFAAFPMEWPRRIIRGWSPSGICVDCGEGRRPVSTKHHERPAGDWNPDRAVENRPVSLARPTSQVTIDGESCGCPEPTAPTRPAVVLDPFGGTGTTALVAHALGRHGISVDMSADYCRLAEWRTTDPGELARALEVPKPAPVDADQSDLLSMLGGTA